MSSVGLNKWIVSGHLAADAEIKTVDLKSGEKAKVAKATIYVRKPRNREDTFTVALTIWEGSNAWRRLPYLKKGSLIICTGSLDANPYISNSDNSPKAGLAMTVLDIDLDNVRYPEEEEEEIAGDRVEATPEVKIPAPPTPSTPNPTKAGDKKSSPSGSDSKAQKQASPVAPKQEPKTPIKP
jgi:single-stranded DNA-binding protein